MKDTIIKGLEFDYWCNIKYIFKGASLIRFEINLSEHSLSMEILGIGFQFKILKSVDMNKLDKKLDELLKD